MAPPREPAGAMPLMAHLRELRTRLVWSVVTIGVAAILAFSFGNQIIRLLLVPFPKDVTIVQIDILEGIRVRTQVALLTGFVVSFPVILYQVIMFIQPALLPHERRFLLIALPVVGGFYVLGVLFSYFVLLPPMMDVLPRFLGDIATPQIRVQSIVGTTIWLLAAMGFVFEIPLVMYLLSRVGLLNPRALGRHHRLAIVLSFAAGAIITPTGDPLNMTLWAVPIVFLYGAGLLLSRLAWWQRQRTARRRT